MVLDAPPVKQLPRGEPAHRAPVDAMVSRWDAGTLRPHATVPVHHCDPLDGLAG